MWPSVEDQNCEIWYIREPDQQERDELHCVVNGPAETHVLKQKKYYDQISSTNAIILLTYTETKFIVF